MQVLGKVAFVTGAAQGLGKAFSEALLQRGARVCLSDINQKKGTVVEKEFQQKYGKDNVVFYECNVSSKDSLEGAFQNAVAKFKHVDLMVNNAGIADESNVLGTVGVNLIGVIQGTQIAVDHMRKDNGGRGGTIINVSSTAGLTGIHPMPVYSASKFGVIGFHKSWSRNPYLGEMGLQFACLCPAFTDTAILNTDRMKVLHLDDAKKLINQVGINKVDAVVEGFIQLVESSYCNGDIMTVTVNDGIQYVQRGKKKSRL